MHIYVHIHIYSSIVNWEEKSPADMPVPPASAYSTTTSSTTSSSTTSASMDNNGSRSEQQSTSAASHIVAVDDVEMYIASNVDPADYYLLL